MKLTDAFGEKIKLRKDAYFQKLTSQRVIILKATQHVIILEKEDGSKLFIEPTCIDSPDSLFALLDYHK